MGVIKRMVKSRSRPEGNIVENYVSEEIVEFVSNYLEGVDAVGLPKSKHEDRLQGVGTIGFKTIRTTHELRQKVHCKVHCKVLQHLSVVTPFIAKHKEELRARNPTKSESWISSQHEINFDTWFEKRVSSSRDIVSESVRLLVDGPSTKIYTYQGYDMNGFTWYTDK